MKEKNVGNPDGGTKFTRRELFKIGALVTGGAVTGAVIGYGINSQQRENEKHSKVGQGTIVEKIDVPSSISPTIIPVGPVTVAGTVNNPERWQLKIKLGNKESIISVTQEEFNSLGKGSVVPVTYDERTMEITGLKKSSSPEVIK